MEKINVTKNPLFFLSGAPIHHSFTFTLQFSYELKHEVDPCKSVRVICHFRFHLVFTKVFIFVQQNSFTLKCHNSFQNYNNRKATHSFPTRTLILSFKNKFENSLISLISLIFAWVGAPQKTYLETNFLNLENRNFGFVIISQ